MQPECRALVGSRVCLNSEGADSEPKAYESSVPGVMMGLSYSDRFSHFESLPMSRRYLCDTAWGHAMQGAQTCRRLVALRLAASRCVTGEAEGSRLDIRHFPHATNVKGLQVRSISRLACICIVRRNTTHAYIIQSLLRASCTAQWPRFSQCRGATSSLGAKTTIPLTDKIVR